MSKPTSRSKNTAKMISRSPNNDDVIISFPVCNRIGFPDEVSTIVLPDKNAKKASPPAIPNTILRIVFTKNSGLAERQPMTV